MPIYLFIGYVLIFLLIGNETQQNKVPFLLGTSYGSKVLTAASEPLFLAALAGQVHSGWAFLLLHFITISLAG